MFITTMPRFLSGGLIVMVSHVWCSVVTALHCGLLRLLLRCL